MPQERVVEIWPAGGGGEQSGFRHLEGAEVLEAGPAVPCLQLDLAQIWNV